MFTDVTRTCGEEQEPAAAFEQLPEQALPVSPAPPEVPPLAVVPPLASRPPLPGTPPVAVTPPAPRLPAAPPGPPADPPQPTPATSVKRTKARSTSTHMVAFTRQKSLQPRPAAQNL